MFLADLHVHSTFSDGKLTIPQIVDFYGSRGFGCIAITDHICEDRTFLGNAASYLNLALTAATFPIYMEILKSEAERAREQYDMLVIPGYELSKNSWSNQRSAHILGLGVSEFMGADGDIVELARALRNQGALAIAAHPVSTRKFEPQTYHLWSRREELAHEFDAWEVASGPHLFDEVARTSLPVIATSDLHHPKQINAWKTVFDCERSQGAVLEAVRKQRLSVRFYQEEVSESALNRLGLDSGIDLLAHGAVARDLGRLSVASTAAPTT